MSVQLFHVGSRHKQRNWGHVYHRNDDPRTRNKNMKESHISNRVSQAELTDFTRSVLAAVGVAEEHIEPIATGLVEADLRGVDSHGVARLETYVENFEAGGFATHPNISVSEPSSGVAIIDADAAPGHSVGRQAIEKAIELAEKNGIGSVFVSNSNHFGTAAFFTQYAAGKDYIGVASSNVGPDVIPFGGQRAFLGTNPISIAVPTSKPFPVTLDMATSMVAMGKIDHGARDEGHDIPSDWGVDDEGTPTTDPNEVAALQPLGGPKGYGLALMVDLFCGILTKSRVSPDITDLYGDFDEPMGLGHWFMAIDVSCLMEPSLFKDAVAAYVDRIKSQPTADGFDEILVPGEPEARRKLIHQEEGIPIRQATADSLERLAERFDIESIT